MTKIFSVDAETDGLYGEVWAIGAAVVEDGKSTVEVFGAQIDPAIVSDPWVRENVVPVVALNVLESRAALLNAFWGFWMEHRDGSVAVADVGTPVEAGLFRACVALDPAGRQWNGPYPLHEVATALLLAGVDPDVDRREYCGRTDLVAHNPVHDALASALCWQQVAPR